MSAGPEWHSWVAMAVSVHLKPGVELDSTVHADEDRVVLHLRGTNFTDVHVFADRADLDRLHAAVTAARDQLTTATATATATATDITDATSTDAADAA